MTLAALRSATVANKCGCLKLGGEEATAQLQDSAYNGADGVHEAVEAWATA